MLCYLSSVLKAPTKNPWFRRLRAGSIALAGLFLAAAFIASIQSKKSSQAVVIVESHPLQAEPAADSASELTIHEGLVVDVVQTNDLWVEVVLPNGTRGWIRRDAVADV